MAIDDGLVYFKEELPGIPEKLLLARDRGEVLFLTGAGVSTPPPSNLPGFRGLVVNIYKELDAPLAVAMEAYLSCVKDAQPVYSEICADLSNEKKEKFEKYSINADWSKFASEFDPRQQAEFKHFAASEFDVALGMLERRMEWASAPTGAMRIAAAKVLNATNVPNSLHRSLDTLARRYGEPLIATTNFDRLHERAGKEKSKKIWGLNSLPRPSRLRSFSGYFHIHGIIEDDVDVAPQIILTDQDFGDVYLRRRIVSDFIYDSIRIYNLVIIGYSANDAPFRYLINAIAGDSAHFPDLKERFAIVPMNQGDDTVVEEWGSRGIKSVCYDEANAHEQLQHLMSAWAESVPQPGDLSWARKSLKSICQVSSNEASEKSKSLFRYIFRRSTPHERGALLEFLGSNSLKSDWLTEANSIVRLTGFRL